MKLSLDFDGVLDQPKIQQLASRLIEHGHELYILTARYEKSEPFIHWEDYWNDELFRIAEQILIPRERIIFCGGANKSEQAKLIGIELHMDDSITWCKDVRKVAKCVWFNYREQDRCIKEFEDLAND